MTRTSTMAHPVASRAATATRLGLLAALVVGLGVSAALSHRPAAGAQAHAGADTSVETVSSTRPRTTSQHAVLRADPHPAPEPSGR